MGYLAFVYKDYDDSGIKNNCRGYFHSDKDALEQIRGCRFGENNLELLDLETHGFICYRWEPDYEYKDEYVVDEDGKPVKDERWPHAPCYFKQRYFLKYRYRKDSEWFEIFKPTNWRASEFGEHNAQYYSGQWNRDR